MSAYDVVIAGAGLTGSILANKLSQAGVRVLLLEAGDTLYFDPVTGRDEREALIERFIAAPTKYPNAPYPSLPYAPSPQEVTLGTPKDYVDESGTTDVFHSTYARIAGGTTWHWEATMLRNVPNTFRERTAFGISVDWPISYDDLDEWYWRAEQEVPTAGNAAEDLNAPRRPGHDYPMPPVLPTYLDRRLGARVEGLVLDGIPVRVDSTPSARNTNPFDDRPPCAGSTNCIPLCPIQAKYDATVHLKRALNPALDPRRGFGARPAEIRLGRVVSRVLTGPGGRVTGLEVIRGDTRETEVVTGGTYVLAMHAAEIPKVLLYSSDRYAAGVANSSGLVGRYLMDHDLLVAYGEADEPLYPFRGPLTTSGIECLNDGPFRRHRSAFRVQIDNIGKSWARGAPYVNVFRHLERGMIGDELRRHVAWEVTRGLEMCALLEPIPDRDNRVTLSDEKDALGLPRPKITYRVGDYTRRGADAWVTLARQIFRRMGCPDDRFGLYPAPTPGARGIAAYNFQGSGHLMGTCTMGVDPRTSVVDSYGRTHDHPNLFLTGSAQFPTVGTSNPTLTIIALTLRTADHLIAELAR